MTTKKKEMRYTDNDIQTKWDEVVDFATQHATGEGLRTGRRWLEDSFNEYFSMLSDIKERSEDWLVGHRELIAQRLAIEVLGNVKGADFRDKMAKLDDTLKDIVNNLPKEHGIRR